MAPDVLPSLGRLSTPSLLTTILFAFALFAPPLGFMPYDWSAANFSHGAVPHKAMTREIYKTLASEFWPDIAKLTGTMIAACDTWIRGNSLVDDDQTQSAFHCDGESIREYHNRTVSLKQQVIGKSDKQPKAYQ
jgi:hypothetical protein